MSEATIVFDTVVELVKGTVKDMVTEVTDTAGACKLELEGLKDEAAGG